MNCIIIEDERYSFELLHDILREYCPMVQIKGHADSIDTSLPLLQQGNIDLVFMDIQLKDGISFEILNKIGKWNFAIVFTTAFDHYALDAFKVEAVDYLLKPYSPSHVIKAVQKVKQKSNEMPSAKLKILIDSIMNTSPQNDRIALSTSDGITLVDKGNIIYCQADGSYCRVITQDQGVILVSKTLGHIESSIDHADFKRVHASYLVNIKYILKYLKSDGGSLVMKNNAQIPVSRSKKNDIMRWLE